MRPLAARSALWIRMRAYKSVLSVFTRFVAADAGHERLSGTAD